MYSSTLAAIRRYRELSQQIDPEESARNDIAELLDSADAALQQLARGIVVRLREAHQGWANKAEIAAILSDEELLYRIVAELVHSDWSRKRKDRPWDQLISLL